jgi:hypothetical protein
MPKRIATEVDELAKLIAERTAKTRELTVELVTCASREELAAFRALPPLPPVPTRPGRVVLTAVHRTLSDILPSE